MAEIGRHDARGQVDEILAGSVGHGLNLSKIVTMQGPRGSNRIPPRRYTSRDRSSLPDMSGLTPT
jgi:hypothetical protein